MRKSVCLVAGVLAGLLFAAQPGRSDAQGEMMRSLAARYQPCLVTLKMVIKSSMGMGDNQSEIEAEGFLLTSSGLVVTTNMSIDPMAAYSSAMGEEGGGGFSSSVTSIKILTAAGEELPARVVLRDKDTNLAFVRPLNKPRHALSAISFNGPGTGTARLGDPVYVLGRQGKAGGRNVEIKAARIVSTMQKPRLRYLLDPYTYIYMGNVVFNERGQPLGLLSMRIGRMGRGGNRPSDGFVATVIPAADVWEVARQAPQAKDVPVGVSPARPKPVPHKTPRPKKHH